MGPLSTRKSWRRVEAKGRRSPMVSNSGEIRLSLKPSGVKEVVSEISRRRKWQSLGKDPDEKERMGFIGGSRGRKLRFRGTQGMERETDGDGKKRKVFLWYTISRHEMEGKESQGSHGTQGIRRRALSSSAGKEDR